MQTPSPTSTILERILEARRAEVEHRKRVLPLTALKYGVNAAAPLRVARIPVLDGRILDLGVVERHVRKAV